MIRELRRTLTRHGCHLVDDVIGQETGGGGGGLEAVQGTAGGAKGVHAQDVMMVRCV